MGPHDQKVIDVYLDGYEYYGGTTYISKVVAPDLYISQGELHVGQHMGLDMCGSTCPKGAKRRPNWRDSSIFIWTHINSQYYPSMSRCTN